jgi:hypothetical protein
VEFRTLELDMEDLDFRDEGRSRDADGFRSQLGMPEDLLDLLCEEILEPGRRACPLQDLALGDGAVDHCGGGILEHSWKL